MSRVLAVIWLLIISVLFFMPGSALPQNDLFTIPLFDKYVHAGFFAILVYWWRAYFRATLKYNKYVLVLAFGYGLSVEIIQHYLIINRSFDGWDLVADTAGAAVGLFMWTKRYIKK